MTPATCPRCGAGLRAPGLMSSAWECERHGAVAPLQRWSKVTPEVLAEVGGRSRVPLWLPLPLLPGWTLGGLAQAGSDRDGARAVALALSGPSPLGGPADVLIVAEEPGVGLGARLAGIDDLDPATLLDHAPDGKLEAAGHPTGLWRCVGCAEDRMAFVGEAGGVWLWVVVWPPAAELILLEHLVLHDVRHENQAGLALPVGAATTRF